MRKDWITPLDINFMHSVQRTNIYRGKRENTLTYWAWQALYTMEREKTRKMNRAQASEILQAVQMLINNEAVCLSGFPAASYITERYQRRHYVSEELRWCCFPTASRVLKSRERGYHWTASLRRFKCKSGPMSSQFDPLCYQWDTALYKRILLCSVSLTYSFNREKRPVQPSIWHLKLKVK
jgi:hypothetical protein